MHLRRTAVPRIDSLQNPDARERPRVLYATDLAYEAKGRDYSAEDLDLTARLREHLDLEIVDPRHAVEVMDAFDVVVVRNTGPVMLYREEYEHFRAEALRRGTKVFTELTGRGDMAGKQYLLDLFAAGYPVIPTVDSREDLGRLPVVDEYVVKPKLGADSVGLSFHDRATLETLELDDQLVQPRIRFRYEVSFYFVDDGFQYALYAPDPARRWELERYEGTDADVEWARRFVAWNTVRHGIQRVDACRTAEGDLLLVELEDLNPYLSLELVDEATRERFVLAFAEAIRRLAAA